MKITEVINNHETLIIVIISLSGLLFGWLIERLILKRILKSMGTRGWAGEPYLHNAIVGFFTFGFFIAGLYAAARYILHEGDIIEQINLSIKILYVIFLTLYFSRAFTAIIRFYTERDDSGFPSSSILINLIRVIILIIGIIFILNIFEISITPILTALGVGGLAVALALQDTLVNLFAGLQILASKKFTIGNTIRLDSGEEGVVEDISWRNTTMRTIRGNTVVVPNAKVSNAILMNFDMPDSEFNIAIECSVSYDSDLEKVEQISIEEAANIMKLPEYIIPDFVPSVSFYEFGDSGILFRVIMRTHVYKNQFKMRHMYIKNIHARFKRENIEIPYPKRDVYIRSGQQNPF